MAHARDELRLVLARLLQLPVLVLNFIEQPHVLDRDHRLVGKGHNQFDLFRRKWLRHSSRYEDHPHDISLAQERSAERRSVAANPLGIMSGIFWIGQHVWNMNKSALDRRSSDNSTSIHRYWMFFRIFLKFRRKPVARRGTEEIAVA